MTPARSRLRLAFYGDDLTGSTDALEALVLAGSRAVLFLDPPAPADLARHPGVEAVGVAGATRALRTAAMAGVLRPAFRALRDLGPRHVHYKICSTFDSSAAIGSIGRAIEVGAEVFGAPYVPLLGGAPGLGRYCVFGNLFARVGIGTAGAIHRLDRLEAMAGHAVTPAEESDLRRHLGRQTRKRIGLLDLLQLGLSRRESKAALRRLVAGGAEVVLFDALGEGDLRRVGELLEAAARPGHALFSVGPSSVEAALATQWGLAGRRPPPRRPAPAAGPVLVASGSCSPVTESQIAFALAHGFAEVKLDPEAALGGLAPWADEAAAAAAARHLGRGRSVVLHTSRGTSDPRFAAARRWGRRRALAPEAVGARLGSALGLTVRRVLGAVRLRRVVVAGGDTSSHAARALGVRSLAMTAAVTRGGPLCRADAPASPLDGCEVVFKGGQVGGPEYFGRFDPRLARRHLYE
ncbi:MAG TPA: four-carbon acid sugar kinase family protein [Opitutaceae bacterium]|nr:four-carbon acid sugar kinase family protein [Opitutaceae bacterium]